MSEATTLPTDVENHDNGHTALHNAVNGQVNWLTKYGIAGETLVFFEDFAGQSTGSIDGKTPLYGGTTWLGTGASPAVASGFLSSASTGYAWNDTTTPGDLYVVEFKFTGTGDDASLTLATSKANNSLNNLLHPSFGAEGLNIQFRIGGTFTVSGTDQVAASVPWRKRLVAGTTYRVSFRVEGETIKVVGPHGEAFAFTDPRVAQLHGRYFFVEPTTAGSGSAKVSKVSVYRAPSTRAADPVESFGLNVDQYGRLVSNRYTVWETTFGRVESNGLTGITFGPYSLVTSLTSATSAAGTTLTTREPLLNGLTLIIDPGGAGQETVTTSSDAGGSGPYTVTVGALANAHAAGVTVLCASVPASKRTTVYWQPGNNVAWQSDRSMILPTSTYFPGQTAFISQPVAGLVKIGGHPAFTGKGAVLVGAGATADRPTASALTSSEGNGAMFFDTTLNKPIWAVGSVWKDAAGNTV